MTQEKFERACEIKAYMNTLMELQDLLANSQGKGFGEKRLAAIDVERFDPSGYVVEDCTISNHIVVPKKIMEQFNSVVKYELGMLKEEFKLL